MRRVAEVLEVSRSQVHERLRHSPQPRAHYRKSKDAELLQPVRRLVDERPTYSDLMLEATERRFGTARTPQPVQLNSDNGSAYRAYESIDFAIRLGLVPCFTPMRSPQSNGMAEAFVETFKRDYVYVHDRLDAQSVLSLLHRSFEDYNGIHPYKALQLKLPREFISSLQQPHLSGRIGSTPDPDAVGTV